MCRGRGGGGTRDGTKMFAFVFPQNIWCPFIFVLEKIQQKCYLVFCPYPIFSKKITKNFDPTRGVEHAEVIYSPNSTYTFTMLNIMNIIMQLYVLHTILKTYYTVYFSTVYTQIMTINEQMKYKITQKKRIDVQNKLLIWYFFLV